METNSPSRGLDVRVWKNICFRANRLAARGAVPGMTADDYRQDLALDLIHRSRWFNPDRASFRTFADRVVGHRAATLAQPVERHRHERLAISLDAVVLDEDGNGVSAHEMLPDGAPPLDEGALARVDLGRFLQRLPPELVECCAMLQGAGIGVEAELAGIHRSTAYERIGRLRAEARSFGLDVYVSRTPDTSEPPPVSAPENVDASGRIGRPSEQGMSRPPNPKLAVTLAELETWLRIAMPGDQLEYHRGFLALDRVIGSRMSADEREQVDGVAARLMDLAEIGQVRLLQRRHGACDYTYIVVAARTGVRRDAGHQAWGNAS